MAIYNGTYDKATKSFTFNGIPNGKYIAVIDYTTEYGDKFNLSRGQITVKGGVNVSSDVIIDKSVITYPVTGVELNQETAEMYVVDTEGMQLTATIIPDKATNKAVTWTSSDPDVATVDQTGHVSPVGIGTTIITVTTSDGQKVASCSISIIPVEVIGVKLDKTELDLYNNGNGVKDHAKLVCIVTPDNATDKSITYESSDPSVIEVDQNGNITVIPLKTDPTTECSITVRSSNGLTDICKIRFMTNYDRIRVPYTDNMKLNQLTSDYCGYYNYETQIPYLSLPICDGNQIELQLDDKPASDLDPFTPPIFVSLDPDIVTVDGTCLVPGSFIGNTTLHFKTIDSMNYAQFVSVTRFPNKFRAKISLFNNDQTKKNILELDEVRNGKIVPVLIAATTVHHKGVYGSVKRNDFFMQYAFITPDSTDQIDISIGQMDTSDNTFIFNIAQGKLPQCGLHKYIDRHFHISTDEGRIERDHFMIMLKCVDPNSESYNKYIGSQQMKPGDKMLADTMIGGMNLDASAYDSPNANLHVDFIEKCMINVDGYRIIDGSDPTAFEFSTPITLEQYETMVASYI